jgi:hypothetical protein
MANERNLTGNRDKDGNLIVMSKQRAEPKEWETSSETDVDKQMQDSVSQAEGEEERYSQMIKALMEAKPEGVDAILTEFESTAREIRDGYAFEEALEDNPDVLKYIHTKARYEDELAKITTEVPEPKGMMKTTLEP